MKDTLSDLKNKLEFLEKNFDVKLEEEEKVKVVVQNCEERVNEILKTREEDIININVGGQHFATKLQTLMNIKDNLFHKLTVSKKYDLKKGIFIDRSPEYFGMILDYFRSGKFNISRLSEEQLIDFKEEVLYYELLEIETFLEKRATSSIAFVKMEVQSPYPGVGSTDVNTLSTKDLTTGVCTNNGYIILELNREIEFDELEIGGFTGKSDWVYSTGYGAGASIETSKDKSNWTYVGTIPTGFGTSIISHKITKSSGKYVRLVYSSWIGLGYFKVKSSS